MVDLAPLHLTRAALMGAFDPLTLLGLTKGKDAPRLRALARVATEVKLGETWLWRLTPDAQREGLAWLPGGDERRKLLADLPPGSGDALGRALRLLLAGGRAPPPIARRRRARPSEAELPELLALLQALELLTNVEVTLEGWAAEPDLARRLAVATVAADKGAASRQILGWTLHGRGTQLAALHAFAARGEVRMPPLVPPEAVTARRSAAAPTVILSGLGGSGKSALIEALRRRLGRGEVIFRAVFDLDQPALRAGNRVALTQELLRQIGEQRDDLDERLSAIRQSLRAGVAAGSEVVDPGREASAVLASLAALNDLLSEDGELPIRLVLIFDTFEEALILGEFQIRLIADWIALLGRRRLQPRVILAGREADRIPVSMLPGLAVQGVLPLGDLGTRAGRALLRDQFRARKVAAEDLVPKLVAVYGSDPLTLVMLARFAESLGSEGRDVRADLIALAEDGASEARARLDGEMQQTFLFSRILNRLPRQDVQALASPGLVLRRITPELIREVLAGPCGLKPGLTRAEATQLFKRLADVRWLVRPVSEEPPMVEHVPELRRRMLSQTLRDPRAKAVAEAAIAWFESLDASDHPGAELEAIYYRALLDPASLPRDPDLLRRLDDHLGVFVADLDFARELFRHARGKIVSQKTVQSLAWGEARFGARDQRIRLQMSEGQERAASAETTMAGGPEERGPMSAGEVTLAFVELRLSVAAAQAPRLARALLDAFPGTVTRLSFTGGEMAAEDLQDLSLAALQAATACLAPEVGPGPATDLRAAVRDWLDDAEQRARLKWAYANATQQSGQLWPARLATVLVLSLADGTALSDLGEALPLGVQGMARLSHSPFAWRSLRLVGPLREGAEVKGIALAYLGHEVMAVVAAEFQAWVGSNVPKPRQEELSRVFRTLFDNPAQVSIRDHNAVDAMLYREDVTIRDRLPSLARLPSAMPGRLPEFHGAFRFILTGDELAPEVVQEAVADLARRVPWWPGDLDPEAFAEAPYSLTLVASLVDTADRCGRLPDLAAALARQAGAPAACQRLSDLIEATASHYRHAADAAHGLQSLPRGREAGPPFQLPDSL
ncbi:AAA family ATPase [Rhodobacter calidifons]|uniref:ATP-binding protein n=1 Tax=Rhodobacter calidifons TaxID=2715277 RepID=A0ABX0G548_9RHOB|nr:AAA family ATPase [Rhodobacter calidifons]NHB75993.1 ATP-binding protein [Rhodobacter calidifons]